MPIGSLYVRLLGTSCVRFTRLMGGPCGISFPSSRSSLSRVWTELSSFGDCLFPIVFAPLEQTRITWTGSRDPGAEFEFQAPFPIHEKPPLCRGGFSVWFRIYRIRTIARAPCRRRIIMPKSIARLKESIRSMLSLACSVSTAACAYMTMLDGHFPHANLGVCNSRSIPPLGIGLRTPFRGRGLL